MFNVREIIKSNMPEIKEGILQELVLDAEFKRKFINALGIKEDIIFLNGDNLKIEVIKKSDK